MNHFQDARFLGVKGQVAGGVHEVVADHLADVAFAVHPHGVDAGVLNGAGGLQVDLLALFHHHFARGGVHHVLRGNLLVDPGGDGKLLIKLIAAHAHEVIALGIKEQGVEQVGGALQAGGFAGLLPLVDLDEAFLAALGVVTLLDGGHQPLILAHELNDLIVGAPAQGAENHRDGQFAGTVNTHPQHVVAVGFIFQPGTAVGDNLGGMQGLAGLVQHAVKIHARRADQLGNNDALGAIDNEGTGVGHQREIAHEHIGFLDFPRFAVFQPDEHLQRRRIGHVPLLAALHRILRLVQGVIHKFQHQIPVIVGNR